MRTKSRATCSRSCLKFGLYTSPSCRERRADGRGPRWRFSDWVAAGGTKDQLLALAAAAPVFVGLPEIQVRAGQPKPPTKPRRSGIDKGRPTSSGSRGKTVVPADLEPVPDFKGRTDHGDSIAPDRRTNLAYMLSKHAATFTKFDARKKATVPINPPPPFFRACSNAGIGVFARLRRH